MNLVIGGFTVGRKIGEGSYGEAFLAKRAGERFVLKLLRASAPDAMAETRFGREAVALQRVRSPNVVGYVHHGIAVLRSGRRPYLVMPFIEGRSLREALDVDQRLDEASIKSLGHSLARGLAACHAAGIVHRDVKPANIILALDGAAVLLDFGVALLLDATTITGAPIGTPAYMAPEQFFGRGEPRSDLYSLGAVLYEALTGRPPLTLGPDPRGWAHEASRLMPELPRAFAPNVSNELENLILQLLSKQPFQRPRSAQTVVDQIASLGSAEMRDPAEEKFGFVPEPLPNETEVIRTNLALGRAVSAIIFPAGIGTNKGHPPAVAKQFTLQTYLDPDLRRLASVSNWPTSDALQSKDQFETMVRRAIRLQLSEGATRIVAPYYYLDNLDRHLLATNLKLIAETRRILAVDRTPLAMVGVLAARLQLLLDEATCTALVNAYSAADVNALWLASPMNDQVASHAELFGYTQTATRLAISGLPVLTRQVGSWGLALHAMGVHGFSSGLLALRSFRPYAKRERSGGNSTDRAYSMPLMQIVKAPIAAAEAVNGRARGEEPCACLGCRSSQPNGWLESRLHYLHCRQEEIRQLDGARRELRIEWLLQRMREAKSLAADHRVAGRPVAVDHFETWLRVLEDVQGGRLAIPA